MLGAVRLHADADHDSGEYAILVRSDLKGTRPRLALMRLMLDWGARRRDGTVEGTVLRENRAMLAVCRRLGFSQSRDPEDMGVVKVELSL